MIPELDSFLDFSWALRPSGIYFLLLRGDVQYVGKSLNVGVRVAAHRNNYRRHLRGLPPKMTNPEPIINFDAVRVLLAPKDRLDALEIQWIQRLNPPGNRQLNRQGPSVNLKKHGFFNHLLVIGTKRLEKEKQLSALIPKRQLRPHDNWLNRTRLIRGVSVNG